MVIRTAILPHLPHLMEIQTAMPDLRTAIMLLPLRLLQLLLDPKLEVYVVGMEALTLVGQLMLVVHSRLRMQLSEEMRMDPL